MSTDPIIRVEDVSKKFCRSLKRTMLYGVRDVSRDVCGLAHNSDGLRPDEFWALDDVSFEVKRGECLGLIGANGAGKSTLLKLLNGITLPDKGAIKVAGRVGALLELGAGFHPMLTGRENIHLNGAILGLTKDEITKKFDAIVEFAGLGEFIDSPVKHYSSGMYVRLGFAIAAHAEPDILLMDESLAVGDAYFAQKCFSAFEQFQKRGVAILFVSHDLNIIRRYCQDVIWLDGGAIVQIGEPKKIIDLYNAMIFDRIAAKTQKSTTRSAKTFVASNAVDGTPRFGTGEAKVVDATLLDSKLRAVDVVTSGEEVTFRLAVRFEAAIKDVVFGITIRDCRGLEVYGTNTLWKNLRLEPCRSGDMVNVEFKQKLMLGSGDYFINVAVNEKRGADLVRLDWIADMIQFRVVAVDEFMGICNLNSEISVQFI
jgi:ABC-type polysaccharide/polyol phosphate transport system ATPase subunit